MRRDDEQGDRMKANGGQKRRMTGFKRQRVQRQHPSRVPAPANPRLVSTRAMEIASEPAVEEELGAPAIFLEPKAATASGVQAAKRVRRLGLVQSAAIVFWLMFLINVVNYLDRFVAAAVGPTLKLEFALSDSEVGLLSTAFLFVYTVAGLPLGLLADRASRARVVAVGVGIWSLFSAYTAFARGFGELFASRIGVGIGEASYLPAGTALLSAYNPLEKRARVMSRWGSGQIVGVALAFIITAVFFRLYEPFVAWRIAFFVTALPGLLLAVCMWFVADSPEGGRRPHTGNGGQSGALEETEATAEASSGHLTLSYQGSWGSPREIARGIVVVSQDLYRHVLSALKIPTNRVAVVLQALYFIVVTPAIIFLPIYVASPAGPFHLGPAQVSAVSGGMLVVGGLSGALLGGNIADLLGRRFPGSRVLTAGVGCAAGLPCYVVTLLTHSLPVFIIFGTVAIFSFSIWAGPLTAAIQDATPPALRATAVAVTLLLAHLCGDIWAPTLVGAISTKLHEQAGLALLLVGIPALLLAIVVSYRGSRIHAADIASRRAL